MTRSTECIVVELRGEVRGAVEELWAELERDYRLHRSHPTAPPHVTLAVAYAESETTRARLAKASRAVAARQRAFSVRGAGYGVFVGDAKQTPVLHVPLTLTPDLAALHVAVLEAVDALGIELEGQSLPEHWRPHLNLADHAVTPDAIGAAMTRLVERVPRHWTFVVDNLTLLTHEELAVAHLPFPNP